MPNIIGYVRATCLTIAALAFDHLPIFTLSYTLNFLLDGLDGFSARYFNQVSRFGYCLDMILDRIGSALLFARLSHICCKPLWMILMMLDLSSHWFMTLSTQEHKKQHNYWVKLYYTHLCATCIGNEVFLLNIVYFNNPYIGVISFPAFAFKQFINIVQLGISTTELVYNKYI